MSTSAISPTRDLIVERYAGHIGAVLRLLIEVMARACKSIAIAVSRGVPGGVPGDASGGLVE